MHAKFANRDAQAPASEVHEVERSPEAGGGSSVLAGDVEHEDGVRARGDGVHGGGLARARLGRFPHQRRRGLGRRDLHRGCAADLRVPA